jgi:hypothetical protein
MSQVTDSADEQESADNDAELTNGDADSLEEVAAVESAELSQDLLSNTELLSTLATDLKSDNPRTVLKALQELMKHANNSPTKKDKTPFSPEHVGRPQSVVEPTFQFTTHKKRGPKKSQTLDGIDRQTPAPIDYNNVLNIVNVKEGRTPKVLVSWNGSATNTWEPTHQIIAIPRLKQLYEEFVSQKKENTKLKRKEYYQASKLKKAANPSEVVQTAPKRQSKVRKPNQRTKSTVPETSRTLESALTADDPTPTEGVPLTAAPNTYVAPAVVANTPVLVAPPVAVVAPAVAVVAPAVAVVAPAVAVVAPVVVAPAVVTVAPAVVVGAPAVVAPTHAVEAIVVPPATPAIQEITDCTQATPRRNTKRRAISSISPKDKKRVAKSPKSPRTPKSNKVINASSPEIDVDKDHMLRFNPYHLSLSIIQQMRINTNIELVPVNVLAGCVEYDRTKVAKYRGNAMAAVKTLQNALLKEGVNDEIILVYSLIDHRVYAIEGNLRIAAAKKSKSIAYLPARVVVVSQPTPKKVGITPPHPLPRKTVGTHFSPSALGLEVAKVTL